MPTFSPLGLAASRSMNSSKSAKLGLQRELKLLCVPRLPNEAVEFGTKGTPCCPHPLASSFTPFQHRCNGCTVDVATSGPAKGLRGIGKLKATITQRFKFPSAQGADAEFDVDADCRLVFFVEKSEIGWQTHFFKGFYEKDKMTAVDPRFTPLLDDEKLASFPDGYKYLAYGQSAAYKIKMDLPQARGQAHDDFYEAFIRWLDGESVEKMKNILGV